MKNLVSWKQVKRLLVLPLLAVSLGTFAQSENSIGFDKVPAEKLEGWLKVTGKVLDAETKEPVQNATLHVDGRDNAARTDKHGNFLLLAKEGDVVHVFHDAMCRLYFIARDEKPKEVLMRYEYMELENMVVVGEAPGKIKKEKVSLEDMEKAPWKEPAPFEGEEVFYEPSIMPEYPGGMGECFRFLAKNIRYPEAALETGVEGQVLVGFTVETDGTITDVHTQKGVCPELDEEAMRVVGLMPEWKPGFLYGKKIAMRYSIPVEFRLQKGLFKKKSAKGKAVKVGYGSYDMEWLKKEK